MLLHKHLTACSQSPLIHGYRNFEATGMTIPHWNAWKRGRASAAVAAVPARNFTSFANCRKALDETEKPLKVCYLRRYPWYYERTTKESLPKVSVIRPIHGLVNSAIVHDRHGSYVRPSISNDIWRSCDITWHIVYHMIKHDMILKFQFEYGHGGLGPTWSHWWQKWGQFTLEHALSESQTKRHKYTY